MFKAVNYFNLTVNALTLPRLRAVGFHLSCRDGEEWEMLHTSLTDEERVHSLLTGEMTRSRISDKATRSAVPLESLALPVGHCYRCEAIADCMRKSLEQILFKAYHKMEIYIAVVPVQYDEA